MSEASTESASERDEPFEWIEARPPSLAHALRCLAGLPRVLMRHRELILSGVRRDLVARFSGTALGRLWPVVSPLLLFGVYYLIFTHLFGLRLSGLAESQRAAMGVYMFIGSVLWMGFSESLSRSASVLIDNATLIKKLAFPAEILPLNMVLSSLVTSGLGVLAFVLVSLFTPLWPAPGWSLAWVPLIALLQAAFAYGLALCLSALNVFLRDTQAALAVVLTVWMFFTPVFWVPVPEALPGIEPWLGWIEANPLHHAFYAWRSVLMSRQPSVCFPDSIQRSILVLAGWAAASLLAGGTVFALLKRRFADEV